MKQKKIIVAILIALISLAVVGFSVANTSHEHTFGEWETKTSASCTSAEVEARICKCGEEETRVGDPATGHTYTSITAVSKMEKPMAGLTVEVSDLSVTADCVYGESIVVTDGITIENATLALGMNTVTVKYGDLSTTLNIEAAELDIMLDGTVTDDTHISSGSKDKENTSKKEMGTKVDEFRAYLRINVKEIINTDLFAANKNNAKVQLVLPITGGSVADETTFKLRTFAPAAGVTDADFSKVTWNSVDKDAAYGGLNWNNGTALVDAGVGHNVSAGNEQITITLAYSQIADFVDENGSIVFAFATNTDSLKIGSLENKTEANRPAVKIILNDEHFHVFEQEVTERKYLVSANCKERAKYRLSCACGEAGTETFTYGGIIDHAYGEAIPEKLNTCTTDGVKEHYQCGRCGKYFLYRDGQMKLVKAEDVKLSAGHDYKLIEAKEPTCTEAGNQKYYKCGACGLYFDADKKETTKDAQKTEKLAHSYGELIEQKDATCTEDGVKAHYECSVCHKTFLDKNGEKVVVNANDLKISAGHETKVIAAKAATCTEGGNNKYYQCEVCSKYFTDKEGTVETTKDAQKTEKLAHFYGELIEQKDATCTEDGMKAHYRCTVCEKYFVEKDGEKTAVSVESLKISAGHSMKVIAQKDATCDKDGNNKYYKCDDCGKYFVDKEGTEETTKEAQKIPAGHTYSELVAQKDATCTEDGMKAHYRCTVCEKYFVEKDGEKTAVSVESLKISAGHNMKVIAQKDATCDKDGNNKYYKCDDCGKYFVDKEGTEETTKEAQKIPAGHTYSELVAQKDATCTEDGVKAHYECAVCHKTFLDKNGEKVVVNANDLRISAGHETKVIAAKEATCTEGGNNKYYQCKVCGKYFVDEDGTQETTKEAQKIEKVPHSYGELIPEQAKTCTEDGVKAHYECSVCHKTFLDKNGEKVVANANDLKISAGHETKVIAAKEATCTEGGNNKYYQCKVCGKYFVDEDGTQETTKEAQKIPALDHTYGEWQNEVPATCTATGTKGHQYCSVCEKNYDANGIEIKNLEIAKLSHNYSDPSESTSTCTTQGMQKHCTCTSCGKYFRVKSDGSYEATSKESLMRKLADHSFGEWQDEIPATCTATGTKGHQYCSTCKKNYDSNGSEIADLTIPAGHTFGEWQDEIPATCTATGTKGHQYCSTCKKNYDSNGSEIANLTIPAGHTFGEWQDEIPATCTATGTKGHQYCSVCKKNYDANGIEIENLVIPKLSHNYSDPSESTSTCTTQGMQKHCTCTSCGKYFRVKSDGSYEATSKESLMRKLADHSFGEWQDEIPATCTATGTKGHQYCSTCKKNYDSNGSEIADLTIPAGHTFGEWQDEIPATCTATGTKGHQYCSVCKKNYDANGIEIENLVIPKLSHNYSDPSESTSTCTTQGMQKHCTCTSCGKYFRVKSDGSYEATSKESLMRKLADHNYVDGVCSVCGATDPDFQQ